MKAEAREVVGWEDKYTVDELGRVFSLFSKRFLIPSPTRDGYLQVALCRDNKRTMKYVHCLVAAAFLGQRGGEVDHIDNDKSNNTLTNLQIVSRAYNVRKDQGKAIQATPIHAGVGFLFPTTRSVVIRGFSQGHTASCARGERSSHKGYFWEYMND